MASRFSIFRANASRKEKAYTLGMLGWMALTCAGGIFYYLGGVHFGLSGTAMPFVLATSAVGGFLAWLPVYRDRHPSNNIRQHSLVLRVGIHAALLLATVSLCFVTFMWLVGPAFTRAVGTDMTGHYMIIQKSSDRSRRRRCDRFIRIQERSSDWRAKICLSRQEWEVFQEGATVAATGRRSILGRTIERIEVVDHKLLNGS